VSIRAAGHETGIRWRDGESSIRVGIMVVGKRQKHPSVLCCGTSFLLVRDYKTNKAQCTYKSASNGCSGQEGREKQAGFRNIGCV